MLDLAITKSNIEILTNIFLKHVSSKFYDTISMADYSITTDDFVYLLAELRKANVLFIPPNMWGNMNTDDFIYQNFDESVAEGDIYNRYSFRALISKIFAILHESLGVHSLDISDDIDNEFLLALSFLDSINPVRTDKIVLKGSFNMSRGLYQNERSKLSFVKITGTLSIRGDVEMGVVTPYTPSLPTKFQCAGVSVYSPLGVILETYESVKDFNNRPQRQKELAEKRKVRKATKQANETGILTFSDSYGYPLEIGSDIIFALGNRVHFGKIIRQTPKKIIVRERLNRYEWSIDPEGLVRL